MATFLLKIKNKIIIYHNVQAFVDCGFKNQIDQIGGCE